MTTTPPELLPVKELKGKTNSLTPLTLEKMDQSTLKEYAYSKPFDLVNRLNIDLEKAKKIIQEARKKLGIGIISSADNIVSKRKRNLILKSECNIDLLVKNFKPQRIYEFYGKSNARRILAYQLIVNSYVKHCMPTIWIDVFRKFGFDSILKILHNSNRRLKKRIFLKKLLICQKVLDCDQIEFLLGNEMERLVTEQKTRFFVIDGLFERTLYDYAQLVKNGKKNSACKRLTMQVDRIMEKLRLLALTHTDLIIILLNNYFTTLPSAYGIARYSDVRLRISQERGSEIIKVSLTKPKRKLKPVELVYGASGLSNILTNQMT